MPIKPYLPRHTTDYLGDALKINIPSQKQWFYILFYSFWLVGWALGEFEVLKVLISSHVWPIFFFMIAWLSIWTFGGVYAIYTLVWQLFGKEVIEISNQAIIMNRVMLGLGFPKEYSVVHIKSLRISVPPTKSDMFGWSQTRRIAGLGGGLIAFDYGSKTISFVIGIDEAEAKQILAEIKLRFLQY
jgi:hypothetical protein